MHWPTEYPHILCFTEHHLSDDELKHTHINSYILRAKYCRVNRRYGGVSTFIHKTLTFTTIDLNEFCNDYDIEICAAKLYLSSSKFCIISVYRPPSGNFPHFLSSLGIILNKLYKKTSNIIICGDFNIDYLTNNPTKIQLDSLLASYNLHSVIHFPTRIANGTCTIIEVFLNKFINNDFSIKSCINGLSDHNGQILLLKNLQIPKSSSGYHMCRLVDDSSMSAFLLHLSFESWEDVFKGDDVDNILIVFLIHILEIFIMSFHFNSVIIHTQINLG